MSDLHQLDKKILGYELCDDPALEHPLSLIRRRNEYIQTLEDDIKAYKQEIRRLKDLLLKARLDICKLKGEMYVAEMGGL